MMYFLDFDRTLFDTDAYNRSLLDEPGCADFRDELAAILPLKRDNTVVPPPERERVWALISKAFESGALSFAPGYLSRFLYADVVETLRGLGNEALIITYGEATRQRLKIESALADVVRLTVLYTEDKPKVDFLAEWPGYYGSDAVLVDDRPAELGPLSEKFPNLRLFEMRRDGGAGDGRWPVIRSLTELP
jgi:FMN phosphatase YigB (HAD superfamily)